jgi:hypothetical protein
LEIERFKCIPLSLEEFVLELNPMETKAMQEALHAIHHHNNCKSDGPENWPHNEGWNNSSDND